MLSSFLYLNLAIQSLLTSGHLVPPQFYTLQTAPTNTTLTVFFLLYTEMQHMELVSLMLRMAAILIQSMEVSCVEEMLQQMFAWIVWKQQYRKSDYVVPNRKMPLLGMTSVNYATQADHLSPLWMKGCVHSAMERIC